ncbi:MBL fold metallo-hydrolase [Chitinimonas koreensis]|uniref:MBL fold metallo-hydrolase n=2 Tax=Chitinimonas koreensis TaxID=356302 RepID=UPI00042869AD|nr:MBL fold metallo-hydrolase [Chitinimonas koreensis]
MSRLFACVLALFASLLSHAADPGFELVPLADGVYAAMRQDPPGYAVEANSLIVVNDRDVLVVDAQSNLAATRAVLTALRRVTDKPVRYVVNTHWHDDHIVGNRVYREAFPGVEFIGHAASLAYLQGPGIAARERFHRDDVPGFSAMLRQALERSRNLAGKPISDEERASYRSDLALAGGYASVAPDFRPELPDITVQDGLTLVRGERSIEIRHLGRGHTAGDLVVFLPRERILAAGDLVVWPIPLIGTGQSHVADWGDTLERLLALGPAVVMPGHGPLLRDDGYIRQVQALMRSASGQVRDALARGETAKEIRRAVTLAPERRAFAGDSAVRDALFSSYVLGPAVDSALADLAPAS